ncbi:DUF1413 domain-containing protein [Pseudomonas sp. SIMBA_059]|uniref:Uncharacterized protein n=2 Tax=Bacteria TaxID=2 RepID=A0A0X7JZH2_9PSED|nr:DUF1413 domain-containing protein [Pseudomonas palleroniana]KWU48849.1 hypothetical protein AWV77_19995 [Pseudomonas palleroniana]
MINIQISLPDQTLLKAIAAASKRGLSLDEYIDMQLSGDDSPPESSPNIASPDPVEDLARTLFLAAIERPEGAPPFLVEELYKQLDLSPWEARSTGTRIRLGKAFMRLVKAQPEGGRLRDDAQVRISIGEKTAQNQQTYRLTRAG